MTNWRSLVPFLLALSTTTTLAILWEFWIASAVLGGHGTNAERWEYVTTSMAFVTVGLLLPAYLHVRSMRQRSEYEDSLERSATIIANTSEAVVTLDDQGRVDRANPSFTRQTGHATEDVLGVHWRELLIPADGEPDAGLLDASHWKGELSVRRKSGPAFPAHATGNALTDATGKSTGYVLAFSDITDRKRAEEQLRYMAQHDDLTQLPNRLTFQTRLGQVLDSAARHHHRAAVLFLDLDNFKHINDTLGHTAGDKLLQAAARRLSGGLRREDTLARISGDEFMLVLSHVRDARSAALVIEKLLSRLREPFVVDGHTLRASASVGVSIYPDDGRTAEDLVKHADIAMYKAKESGRGTYCFYQPELSASVEERMRLEQALRRALAEDELELHYQPQYEIATRRLVGFEALVRWRHPERGLLLPGSFLDVAEDSGLIIPLGEKVLQIACDQAPRWGLEKLGNVRLAVNVSARQVLDHGFLRFLEAHENPAAPYRDWLDLELTESALIRKDERTLQALQQIQSLGIGLVLDDFGTGYSSFGYLHAFSLDKVKIDQSFIAELSQPDSNSSTLVRAMVAMSRELGLDVVAEGVETETQADLLSAIGCTFGQGHYYAPPAPPDEIGAILFDTPASDGCTVTRAARTPTGPPPGRAD